MTPYREKWRKVKDRGFMTCVILISLLSMLPLFLILFYIIKNGLSALSWNIFFEIPKPVGEKGGGISNAIVGSFFLVVIAAVPSIPLGIAAGVYLSEHKDSKLSYLGRLAAEILQ